MKRKKTGKFQLLRPGGRFGATGRSASHRYLMAGLNCYHSDAESRVAQVLCFLERIVQSHLALEADPAGPGKRGKKKYRERLPNPKPSLLNREP